MTIIELLSEIGIGNLEIQFLDQCMTNYTESAKKGNHITFGTEMTAGFDVQTKKQGVIVWLDREKVKEAIAREKAAKAEGR